ncbi:MAG TPA: peptide chain release factor N(5)-glutamine methyltransferase, partial [Pseudomonadales bacterium]
REFWSLDFRISADTLVPRPESETVVEAARAGIAARARALSILDLGTGSGCLLLALLSELPNATGLGADISAPALRIAAANAAALGLASRARFVAADWGRGLAGAFDVIVANPPYVAAGDPHLAALSHEPRSALIGGTDGLAELRRIVAEAPAHLEPGGWLLVEHGYDQATPVRRLFETAGFQDIELVRDLGDQPRVTLGRRGENRGTL